MQFVLIFIKMHTLNRSQQIRQQQNARKKILTHSPMLMRTVSLYLSLGGPPHFSPFLVDGLISLQKLNVVHVAWNLDFD